MAFLTVAAIDLRALEDSATEKQTLYSGGRERAYNNTLISTEDPTTAKRVFDVQVDLYSPAEETALRAACPIGDAVAVSGDFIGGTLQCVVDITDAKPWQTTDDTGYLIYKVLTLHIEEV